MESLYGTDFPLFEGDLLEEFSLAANSPLNHLNELKGVSQPPLSPEAEFKAGLAQNLNSTPAPVFEDLGQTFQAKWLDTKVDLLEFLEDDHIGNAASPGSDQDEESAHAMDMLSQLTAPVAVEQIKADNVNLMEALSSLTEALDVPIEFERDPSVNGDQPSIVEIAQPLSPVSVDDIESILSENGQSAANTAPPSPYNSDHDATFNTILEDLMSADQPEDSVGPVRKSKSRRKAPYGSAKKDYDKTLDRKERKKQQNKDAALRYRSKKKTEHDSLNVQAEKLEAKNQELRDKVDSISREIQYLKDLMAEVHKAKTQQ